MVRVIVGSQAPQMESSAFGAPAAELVLVALAGNDGDHELIRAGKQLADNLQAGWTVVSVEPSGLWLTPDRVRARRLELSRVAQSLGAEAVTLRGQSELRVLGNYARLRRASRVLIGAPARSGLRALAHCIQVTALKRKLPRVDVITVASDSRGVEKRVAGVSSLRAVAPAAGNRALAYLWAPIVTAGSAAAAALMPEHVDLMNIAMVYLLGAVVAGLLLRRGPAVLAAALSVLAFDYFNVPPRYSLLIAEPSYLVTFAEMLLVALIIANLMIAVRDRSAAARARERHTAAMYAITRDLMIARDAEAMKRAVVRHIGELLHCDARVLLYDASGQGAAPKASPMPSEREHCLPLRDLQTAVGVLIVERCTASDTQSRDQLELLQAIAQQLTLALLRARMAEGAHVAQLEAQRTALRNAILSSIARDLRAPLSAIAGAGSIVAHAGFVLDHRRRVTLGRLIEDKALELAEVLANMLELARLEACADAIDRDWDALSELIGLAIERQKAWLQDHEINLDLPPGLPLVYVDANLMVQLFSNLLNNAARYTPHGTRIDVRARCDGAVLRVVIEDAGPGFGTEVFILPLEKRVAANVAREGRAGLGLSVCRAVARRHGGDIAVGASSLGGARVEVTIPLLDEQPAAGSVSSVA